MEKVVWDFKSFRIISMTLLMLFGLLFISGCERVVTEEEFDKIHVSCDFQSDETLGEFGEFYESDCSIYNGLDYEINLLRVAYNVTFYDGSTRSGLSSIFINSKMPPGETTYDTTGLFDSNDDSGKVPDFNLDDIESIDVKVRSAEYQNFD